MSAVTDDQASSLTSARSVGTVAPDATPLSELDPADPNLADGTPLAVVQPSTPEDIATAVRWAAQRRVPVVIRGRGTRTPDGLSTDGALVVCTTALTGVTVNPLTGRAVALAGTPADAVRRAAAMAGWALPTVSATPASTIGGDVATDAATPLRHTLGSTSDYVVGLQVVRADGTALRIGSGGVVPPHRLSLARLFTGSHGLLAVVTEVTLQLVRPPAPTRVVLASFRDQGAAAEAAFEISLTQRPGLLTVFNATAAAASGVSGRGAALLCAVPGSDDLQHAAAACLGHGAVELTCNTATDVRAVAAPLRGLRRLHRRGRTMTMNVPPTRLTELLRQADEIADEHGLSLMLVGHPFDGRVECAASPRADARRATFATMRLLHTARRLGTHATGRSSEPPRHPWASRVVHGAAADVDRGLKVALDPAGLFNPGLLY